MENVHSEGSDIVDLQIAWNENLRLPSPPPPALKKRIVVNSPSFIVL